MKQYLALLALIILAAPALATENIFDHTLYSASSVTLDVDISNSIHVTGQAQEVRARLFYFPKDFETQHVRNVRIQPEATPEEDHLLFTWRNAQGTLEFSHQSTVTSTFHQPQIREKILFPYAFVPPEKSRYLISEEIIRITPAIRRQAEEIIGEETDAVRVAFLLGTWVQANIEYDLSSVAVQASMPSDWVLNNREGVCEELTSLFIAMLRSQGIPARFISGVAYTNLEILDTNWGPHGWAEVWFPDVGWVPYDVTYGQYGFVDATHIAIQKTTDAATNAAEYSMRSRGGDFTPEPLTRVFTLVDRGPERTPDIDLRLRPALEHVGFGSYNRIDVDIINRRDYYISADLYFGRTNGLTSLQNTTSILLEPNQQKTLHWYVNVDEDLRSGFEYTFPLRVSSNVGREAETEFRSTQQGMHAQREDIELEEASITRGLASDIECTFPETVFAAEPFRVTCTYPEVVELCLTQCVQGTNITQTFSFTRLGAHTAIARAQRGESSTQKILTFIVVDEPQLALSANTTSPVGYQDEVIIHIQLEKTSVTDPQDILVTFENRNFFEEFTVERLSSRHTIEIRIPAHHLTAHNEFLVTARYDAFEEQMSEQTTIEVLVVPESFGERMALISNRFFAWLDRLFS